MDACQKCVEFREAIDRMFLMACERGGCKLAVSRGVECPANNDGAELVALMGGKEYLVDLLFRVTRGRMED